MTTCNSNPCPNNKRRLPCDWIDVLNSKFQATGNWSDFNCKYHSWNKLNRSANDDHGLVCADDIVKNPVVDDYTDLTAPATVGCGKYSIDILGRYEP